MVDQSDLGNKGTSKSIKRSCADLWYLLIKPPEVLILRIQICIFCAIVAIMSKLQKKITRV